MTNNPLEILSKYLPVKILDNLKNGKLALAIKIFSGNKLYRSEGNTIVLNYSPTYINTTNEIVSSLYESDQGFLNLSRNHGVETISSYKSEASDDIVEFFHGKLSEEDYLILRISKYIKSLYNSGKKDEGDVRRSDLQRRYGKRGLNICNLFSEGYFKESFKPLYELLVETGDPDYMRDFEEVMSIYIDNPLIIFFVNSNKNYIRTSESFKDLLDHNITYGIYRINIHAINKDNVKKVKKLIEDFKEDIDRVEMIEKGESIMAKVFLKMKDNVCLPTRRVELAKLST